MIIQYPKKPARSSLSLIAETQRLLSNRGLTASRQNIQRAIWRGRKQNGRVNGQYLSRYLILNKIAEPVIHLEKATE